MRVIVASTDRNLQMELICLSSVYAALCVFMILWCKEKELSKIIPRLLSDLLNSVGMLLILNVGGKALNCFCFVIVHLKFVAYHPGFDITYAFLNVLDGSTDFRWTTRAV